MNNKKLPKILGTGHDIQEVLRVWRSLEAVVMTLGEQDLQTLYRAELAGKGRRLFLQRIYGRFSRMRALKEQAELRGGIKDGD